MKTAPPIIGPLEFAGLKNSVILVEMDEEDNMLSLLREPTSGKNNIIFSPQEFSITEFKFNFVNTAFVFNTSIATIHRMVKAVKSDVDYYIIDRVDLMNLEFSKRESGSQIKAYISMLCSPLTLCGANLIVTSCNSEYTIREIADVFLNLRK